MHLYRFGWMAAKCWYHKLALYSEPSFRVTKQGPPKLSEWLGLPSYCIVLTQVSY